MDPSEEEKAALVANPVPVTLAAVQTQLTTLKDAGGTTLVKVTGPGSVSSAQSSFMKSPGGSRTGSRAGSRATSPTRSEASDDLPTNVSTQEQLDDLPLECLSRNPARPLQHLDEYGLSTAYALNPMMYSVLFILIIELLERFAFYGINYTQTSFLTGAYNKDWNAGMEAVSASTYVSVSVAVAYTTPFIGALLADTVLGDYWTLLAGCLCFYLPGLLLIAFTTVPGLLGDEFNTKALATGLLFLWPVGTGIVKSVVNVFGARQFHPLLQSSLIESYYVNFYMAINIGALIGGVVVPLACQVNVTAAYFLPVATLSLGIILFLSGTKRYVKNHPKTDAFKKTGRAEADAFNPGSILFISFLVVPFNIAYSQMSTTFIIQGTVMRKALGFIDAACMNNADAVAVLVVGTFISSHFYPWLNNRGIKIPTTYKFAIGSMFGVLAIGWAIFVDYLIHKTYNETGQKITIMYQTVSYVLIGIGEIFAVSAAYEAAFACSPPEKKVLASAVNLFCIGGMPNVICIALYNLCEPWFKNSQGTTKITHIHDYATAHVANYFWVLFFIALAGTIVNLLPIVREYVEDIEEKSADLIKTPKTPVRPPRRERMEAGEESPLLRAQRHQAYLKYGSAPVLNRSGSMRAGPVQKGKVKERKHMKKAQLRSLYGTKAQARAQASPAAGGQKHYFIPPAASGLPGASPKSHSFPDAPAMNRANSD